MHSSIEALSSEEEDENATTTTAATPTRRRREVTQIQAYNREAPQQEQGEHLAAESTNADGVSEPVIYPIFAFLSTVDKPLITTSSYPSLIHFLKSYLSCETN